MARPAKAREIQVQKPSQSLAHFQTKYNQGREEDAGLIKPILMGVAALVLVGILVGAWSAWRTSVAEKHEAAVAALQMAVEGDGVTPVPPAEVEKRMQAHLAQLEALVQSAPGAQKATTAGLLATWRLALSGKEQAPPPAQDPWARIRLAQRALALGQAQEARTQLNPLRAKALPDEDWAEAFWAAQMDANRLAGDRSQALKDLADYKARFKGQGSVDAMEGLLKSI